MRLLFHDDLTIRVIGSQDADVFFVKLRRYALNSCDCWMELGRRVTVKEAILALYLRDNLLGHGTMFWRMIRCVMLRGIQTWRIVSLSMFSFKLMTRNFFVILLLFAGMIPRTLFARFFRL